MSDNKYSSSFLSGLDAKELASSLTNCKKELFNLRFQAASGELKNTASFSAVRKNAARVKTELTKRKKRCI